MSKNIKKMVLLIGVMLSYSSLATNEFNKGVNNFVTLGTGNRCDFDTNGGFNLQDVLTTNATEIRIDTSITYTGQFIPSHSVHIRGGYASCGDAINDIQSITPTVLDGNSLGTVLSINTNGAYILENIVLTNGDAGTANGGGLALNASDMTMTLDKVRISNNVATNGGGIYKPGNSPVLLVIHDSVIKNNTATGSGVGLGLGGGICYSNDGELIVYGDTEISNNTAIYGGGIFLRGTTASLASGQLSTTGVSFNKALHSGGGLYIDGSTNLTVSGGESNIPGFGLVGVSGKNYNIIFNEADSDSNGTGSGGGLYSHTSTINMNAVTLSSNNSNKHGGGMDVNYSNLIVGRPQSSDCQINAGETGCNFMAFNTTVGFGGAIMSAFSNLTITATNFNNNRAHIGTVGLFSSGGNIKIYSSIFHDNGASGTGGYSDRNVLWFNYSVEMDLIHLTAIHNNSKDSFIKNNGGILNSYANIFYNDISNFPWLSGSGISHYSCQILDDTNNQTDTNKNIEVIPTSALSTAFVDYVNYDYHIMPTSFLYNYTENWCDVNPGNSISPKDIDGETRTTQRDLGADEFLEDVFNNSFE